MAVDRAAGGDPFSSSQTLQRPAKVSASTLSAAASSRMTVAAAVARVLVGHAADLVPAPAVGTQFLDVRTLIGTGKVAPHPAAAPACRALHG